MSVVAYYEINRKYFFYPWFSKLNFLFVNEMHTVFMEKQLTPDCFPVAKILFVSENLISHFKMPC